MSTRDLYRSLNPERRKNKTMCPDCFRTTYITKNGRYFRHRMPPMNSGYYMPNVAGPICKMSGRPALQ